VLLELDAVGPAPPAPPLDALVTPAPPAPRELTPSTTTFPPHPKRIIAALASNALLALILTSVCLGGRLRKIGRRHFDFAMACPRRDGARPLPQRPTRR
jgi:hypothetical protein